MSLPNAQPRTSEPVQGGLPFGTGTVLANP